MTTATLTDDEIEDRFYLRGAQQIIATLGQFIYQGIPVTVHFNNGSEFILTTLLEARRESLIFDLGGDAEANARFLNSASCTFVTSVNGIRIQFSTAGGVKKVWWGDAEAFAVKLPNRLIRLQRRETFRVITPVVKFIAVRLQYIQAGVSRIETFPLHDLSVSGLGITLTHPSGQETGQVIEQAAFTLPGSHAIECGGAIRHVTRVVEGPNSHSYRMGICFNKLPRPIEIAIQRYIIGLELSRHKLAAESI